MDEIQGGKQIPGVVDEYQAMVGKDPGLIGLKTNNSGGIANSVENSVIVVSRAELTGVHIALDNFRSEIMLRTGAEWKPFVDADYTRLRIAMDRIGFADTSMDKVRAAVRHVAVMNQFDSAIDWLSSLEWDGTNRVSSFMKTYMGATGSDDYLAAVSEYVWSAMTGRVLIPGIKADMVPVLVGGQGCLKSTAIEALAPHPDLFTTIALDMKETEIVRTTRGKLVVEIGELDGLTKRGNRFTKRFLANKHDEHREAYAEMTKKLCRRYVFWGSVNDRFLSDPTGHRRWLPVEVSQTKADKIASDREQLWAEATVMFRKSGIRWSDAETLARNVHSDHEIEEPWAELLADWLSHRPDNHDLAAKYKTNGERQDLTPPKVYAALGITTERVDKHVANRVAEAMRQCGYARMKNAFRTDEGKALSVWRPI